MYIFHPINSEKIVRLVSYDMIGCTFCVQSRISRNFVYGSIAGPRLKCVEMMLYWVSTWEYDRVCVQCVGDKLVLCVFRWYWKGRKYLSNIVARRLSTV